MGLVVFLTVYVSVVVFSCKLFIKSFYNAMDVNTDLTKLKVAELKNELKVRGLSTVGKRTELLDRLKEAIADGVEVNDGEGEEIDEDEILAGAEEDEELTPAEEEQALAGTVKEKEESPAKPPTPKVASPPPAKKTPAAEPAEGEPAAKQAKTDEAEALLAKMRPLRRDKKGLALWRKKSKARR